MFAYIRVFSFIAFLIVVCASLIVGHYFKVNASSDLIAVVEDSNASLAKGFINTTWKTHRDQVKTAAELYNRFRASGLQIEQWKQYQGYKEMIEALDDFSKSVFKYFDDMPIAEKSIYTTSGTRLISTDQSRIIATEGSSTLLSNAPPQVVRSDGAFDAALSGETSSVVLQDEPFVKSDGTPTRGVLIKTLIPVMRNNSFVPIVANYKQAGKTNISCVDTDKTTDRNCVEAVMEIRYDVTRQWGQLDRFQYIGTVGVLAIFTTIILMLLYTSHKAESIIARQHETNLELAAQAASAQAENRDKSQFLANISHELRTPLNAIIGFSEFIKSERSGPIGNEKYGEYIKDIHGSGVHLLSLINDILDYSKAEADKLELEISEVDATKSVKNSMRLVSPRADAAQVQLIESIPREHFIIKTDAKKLKQIMLNLLSNAVKFTPSGGSVVVSMWQNVVDGSLSIEVKDTGIGIAPKDISRAMAPFGQVDNTLSRKYEGTGLGLPLTRKFVEIMDGTFSIQSEVGKGTSITVTLPKESQGKAAPADPESAAESNA